MLNGPIRVLQVPAYLFAHVEVVRVISYWNSLLSFSFVSVCLVGFFENGYGSLMSDNQCMGELLFITFKIIFTYIFIYI